jgi:hypothetical protein
VIPPLAPREWVVWWAGLALGVAADWLRRALPWVLLVALLGASLWALTGCDGWSVHCGPWGLLPDDCLGARPGGGL